MEYSKITHVFTNVAPYNSPGHLNDFIHRIEDCCDWLENTLNLEIKGRIPIYIKAVKTYERHRGTFGDGLYDVLQSLSEMLDLIEISEQLKQQSSKNFIKSVENALHGPTYRGTSKEEAEREKFRNYLLELKIAASLRKIGFDINLSTKTDIIITDIQKAAECKRITSIDKILIRTKEAIKQIVDNSDGQPTSGLVYIDLTSLFENPASVFVINETGFPITMLPPRTDKEIIEEIFDHIKSKAEEILDPIKSNISQLISPQIHGIVVSFDYLAFHVSLVDERAITGRFNYLIMSKDHEQEFMEKIKLTLGTSF
jgi:hypothetical protein